MLIRFNLSLLYSIIIPCHREIKHNRTFLNETNDSLHHIVNLPPPSHCHAMLIAWRCAWASFTKHFNYPKPVVQRKAMWASLHRYSFILSPFCTNGFLQHNTMRSWTQRTSASISLQISPLITLPCNANCMAVCLDFIHQTLYPF